MLTLNTYLLHTLYFIVCTIFKVPINLKRLRYSPIYFFSSVQLYYILYIYNIYLTVNTLFSIDNPTLNRFYSLHYTLPFILAGLSIFHIAALHQYGSTNPLGVNTQTSTVPFSVYFVSKDLLGLLFLLFAFAYLVFFYPELLGHPDNLIPANPYSTPQHIIPEWYFLNQGLNYIIL